MELNELIEEKWDEHSTQIGSDIDDLSYYAGSCVITEADFKKAANEIIQDQSTAWAIWKQKAEDCRKALKWYKVQAELAKQTKDTDARLSIVTALELDGGARATKALEQWK